MTWCQSGTRPLSTHYVDGLVQDCSIPVVNALEILQSSNEPSGCMGLHITFICHTCCHFNATHMVNFMIYPGGRCQSGTGPLPKHYIDALVQAHSISIADALETLQSHIKPSGYVSLHMSIDISHPLPYQFLTYGQFHGYI